MSSVSERWEGRSYAEASAHHRAQDEWFLDRHRPGPGDRVVDVGCGSGEFTALLAALVPEGSVLGVEPDPSMVEAARGHQLPNLSFVQAPAQELDRVVDARSADLVVSRAALHWIALEEHRRCYQAMHTVLRPGGVLHTESAGAGNLPRLIPVLDDVAAGLGLPPAQVTLLTPSTVLELLEEVGFRPGPDDVRSVAQRRPMSRDELLAMVRTQAVHAYESPEPDVRARFLEAAARRIDEMRREDGAYDQTFVRLEVFVRR
jgi:trans-aconitate methyltransferase